jgi:hypothetical protein
MITPGGPLAEKSSIYRALNPKHYEDGLPGDNHFVMNPQGDGVSTGITDLISLSELRSIGAIQQIYGAACGVAELIVGEVLAPVATLGISVIQQDAPDWGRFAAAHAVITGYQILHGREGKRRIRDFQRHLVTLARRRFYPAESDTPLVG